jgi:hypothetical protein
MSKKYMVWGCASDAPNCWVWGEGPNGMLCGESPTPVQKFDGKRFHLVPSARCPEPLKDAFSQKGYGWIAPFKTKVANNPPATSKPVAKPAPPPPAPTVTKKDEGLLPEDPGGLGTAVIDEIGRLRTGGYSPQKPVPAPAPAPQPPAQKVSPTLPPQGNAPPIRDSDVTGTGNPGQGTPGTGVQASPGTGVQASPGTGIQSGVSGPAGGPGGLLLDVEPTRRTEDTGDLTDRVLRMRKTAR